MATAGVINVFMNANVSGFKKGLDRSRSLLSGFVGSATSLLSSATSTLQDWVDEVGDSISPVAALSARLGIASDELMALEHAADSSSISIGVFRKGLERMSKRLGDVQRGMTGAVNTTVELSEGVAEVSGGSGPAAKALDTLGLSIQEIGVMKPEEQFRKIAQAISELDSQSEKLSVTQNLFGASGRSLLNLLDEGEEGIERLTKEARDLGLTLGDVDANNIADMSTALSKVGSALTSIKQNVVAELAPSITTLAELWTEWSTTSLREAGGLRGIISGITDGIMMTTDMLHMLRPVGQAAWALLTTGSHLFWRVVEGIGKGIESLINLFPGMSVSFSSSLSEIADEAGRIAEENQKAAEESFAAWTDPSTLPSEQLRNMLEDIKDNASDTQNALDDLSPEGLSEEALKARQELEKQAADVFDSTRTPMENFQSRMEDLRKLFAEGLIDSDTFNRAVDKAETTLKDRLGEMESSIQDGLEFSRGMELGSVDALRTINANRLGRADDAQVKVAKDQLDTQREIREGIDNLAMRLMSATPNVLDV